MEVEVRIQGSTVAMENHLLNDAALLPPDVRHATIVVGEPLNYEVLFEP